MSLPDIRGDPDPDPRIHVETGIRTTYDIDPDFDRFVTDSNPQYRKATDPN